MPRVTELYPLPEEERRALIGMTLRSEVLIAALGVMAAFVLTGLSPKGWLYAITGGWMADILQKMTPHWTMLLLPVVAICLVILIDKSGIKHSASYRGQKTEVAQGVNGELPRVGAGWMLLFSALAGICEELLFRYAFMGLLMLVFGLFFDWLPAAAATVVVSSAIFAVIHTQYRNPWSIGLVVCLSLLFSVSYLVTDSLLVVMVTHAVYDAGIMFYERHRMTADPDYFAGRPPTDFVRKLIEGQEKPRPQQPQPQPQSQSTESE